MKKARAIELLGGTPKKAAAAMGYRAVQTIYLWPDELPQATADRVMGVVGRLTSALEQQAAGSECAAQEATVGEVSNA